METYKVIIWGFGMVGKSALKIIDQREQLELAGVIDVDPKKLDRMPERWQASRKQGSS